MTALNPVMSCGDQVDELLRTHTDWGAAQRKAKILRVLDRVKLPEPERIYRSFPRQLSGRQRQRIVIAMAVILKPALLIWDEPTTALDVTMQKGILSLIAELQGELGAAVLFITHDLRVAAQLCDRVIVMHQGRIVEQGAAVQLYAASQHDYTRKLFAAAPGMAP